MKRLFDFITSLIGLIVLFPIFIIISLLVKISSKGPVFFVQKRIGRNCKIFQMVKFRSMTVIQNSNSTISVKGDIRITNVGAFLRKFKLDELPELWNVLKGDMSLVGPRPDVCGYADNLEGEDRKILELRPGITGLAQVMGYDMSNPEALSKIDAIYARNKSLGIDSVILLATFINFPKKFLSQWFGIEDISTVK